MVRKYTILKNGRERDMQFIGCWNGTLFKFNKSLFIELEHSICCLEQTCAIVSQGELAGISVEQRAAKISLKLREMHACRRGSQS